MGQDKFTIDDLIEYPRRSAAVVNNAGTYAVFTSSSYSLAQKEKSSSLRLLDVDAHTEIEITTEKGVKNPVFIAETQLLYLHDKDEQTKLMKYDISTKKCDELHQWDCVVSHLQFSPAGKLSGLIRNKSLIHGQQVS